MKKVAIIIFSLLVGYPTLVVARDFPSNGVSVHISYALAGVPIACSYERYVNVGKAQFGFGAGVTYFLIAPDFSGLFDTSVGPHISASIILGQGFIRLEAILHTSLLVSVDSFDDLLFVPGVNVGVRIGGSEWPFFFRLALGLPDGVGGAFGYTF